jgi:hypothetical protein
MSTPPAISLAAVDDSFDDWDADALRYEAQAEAVRENIRCGKPATPLTKMALAPAIVPSTGRSIASLEPMPHRTRTGLYPALATRSALFGVARADPSGPDLPLHTVPAHLHYHLEYEGPRLSVRDKSIWEAAIDLGKESGLPAGAAMPMPLRTIGDRLGLASTGGDQLDWIWDGLKRLEKARVAFDSPTGQRIAGPLLGSVEMHSGAVAVSFDPGVTKHLIGRDMQFRIDTKRRRTLGSGLARWLHDFLSSHNEPEPMDLKYLRNLCGYEAKKRRFPADLEKAMGEITQKASGLAKGFKINRSGKDSDMWTLEVTQGHEKPSFIPATRAARTGGGGSAQAKGAAAGGGTPAARRRGGVAL